MRFLCMQCVVILSVLVTVRCFVSTPEPLKAASNILRWVLANDNDWTTILTQKLDVKEVDFDTMLADLKLTQEPDAGITPNAIIQRLVTHEGTTGSQIMYGIRVLGIALNNQFMTTLMVHSYLTSKFAESKQADPAAIRVCISKIQLSIVNFLSKLAFFGHPIDIYSQLNDEINEFFKTNNEILNSTKTKMSTTIRNTIVQFLSTLFETTKEKVQEASYNFKNINDETIQNIMIDLKLIGYDLTSTIEKIEIHNLYSMIIEIDNYEQVNVSSIGLDFIEKRFNIQKYLPKIDKPQLE